MKILSFFNADWQELESRQEPGSCHEPGTASPDLTTYVWGLRYVDDLVYRERGDERLYSLADPNWNVVATANEEGEIQERFVYDGFGRVHGLTSDWNRTFTGQVLDHETGLMLYRNRFYHVDLGRFVSRDPIGYSSGDENLCRYVFNSPKNFHDELGFGNGMHPWPDPPPKPRLPDFANSIWACVPANCPCSAEDLVQTLQDIQGAIDDTVVSIFGSGPCQRWGNKFACKIGGGGGYISPSPCLSRNSGMLWEPYMIIGGHTYFEFEICGGTVIRVENHARNFGRGQFDVTLPENCPKCPK